MLASGSVARSRLLSQVGISHKVMISGVHEESFGENDPKGLVQKLALAKAIAVSERLVKAENNNFWPNEITSILGCDSVFEFRGETFGKPADGKEAAKRLQMISGETGTLHTGHAFLKENFLIKDNHERIREEEKLVDVVSTRVNFADISKSEIDDYVATGEPLGCAGAFSLEGKSGLFISSLEGCYSNVIGLSLPWLRGAMYSFTGNNL